MKIWKHFPSAKTLYFYWKSSFQIDHFGGIRINVHIRTRTCVDIHSTYVCGQYLRFLTDVLKHRTGLKTLLVTKTTKLEKWYHLFSIAVLKGGVGVSQSV